MLSILTETFLEFFFLFSFSRIDSFLVEEFIFWNPLRNFEFNKAENKCIDKS